MFGAADGIMITAEEAGMTLNFGRPAATVRRGSGPLDAPMTRMSLRHNTHEGPQRPENRYMLGECSPVNHHGTSTADYFAACPPSAGVDEWEKGMAELGGPADHREYLPATMPRQQKVNRIGAAVNCRAIAESLLEA